MDCLHLRSCEYGPFDLDQRSYHILLNMRGDSTFRFTPSCLKYK